jgi:hypothetical protein
VMTGGAGNPSPGEYEAGAPPAERVGPPSLTPKRPEVKGHIWVYIRRFPQRADFLEKVPLNGHLVAPKKCPTKGMGMGTGTT